MAEWARQAKGGCLERQHAFLQLVVQRTCKLVDAAHLLGFDLALQCTAHQMKLKRRLYRQQHKRHDHGAE